MTNTWGTTVTSQGLSATETEVMLVLWDLGAGTVADVQKALLPDREMAYTTVATLLTRMEAKGAVTATKNGRSFVYEPVASKKDFRENRLSGLVQQLFEGRPLSLASHFIKTNSFSKDELDELRKLLDEKETR